MFLLLVNSIQILPIYLSAQHADAIQSAFTQTLNMANSNFHVLDIHV